MIIIKLISKLRSALGLVRQGKEWTKWEDKFLKEKSKEYTDKELSLIMTRTENAIRSRRYNLKNGIQG